MQSTRYYKARLSDQERLPLLALGLVNQDITIKYQRAGSFFEEQQKEHKPFVSTVVITKHGKPTNLYFMEDKAGLVVGKETTISKIKECLRLNSAKVLP